MAMSRSRGSRRVTSRPPKRMLPESACSSPARRRSSVDLPHPLGPTSTANAPSGMARLTPLRTGVWPNCLLRSRTSTEAIGGASVAGDLALGDEHRRGEGLHLDLEGAVGGDGVRH